MFILYFFLLEIFKLQFYFNKGQNLLVMKFDVSNWLVKLIVLLIKDIIVLLLSDGD